MRTWASSLLMSLLAAGCDDPLPPYQRPTAIVETVVPAATLDTVTIVESFEAFGPDSNLILIPASPVHFKFYAENLYDETLYGAAAISGKLELWVSDRPYLKRTISVSSDNLMPTLVYNSRTHNLTLDPKTPLWFDVPWDLKQDNGRFLHHDLP
ncbi:MAG TPA: hypothetical protein VMG34_03385, partial [Bacteroidota bacterium]|nr:hypothetical protein [Bacteroidota bacterium]